MKGILLKIDLDDVGLQWLFLTMYRLLVLEREELYQVCTYRTMGTYRNEKPT